MMDLEHDRAHPVRSLRPLAAGEVTPRAAVVALALCAVLALILAVRLPPLFMLSWAAYLVLTTAYSFGLKRVALLDVVILAALYTVRVVAGAAAVDVPLSRWFLAFSVFIFLSLAMLKRLVETKGVAARDGEVLAGRGWEVADAPLLLGFGAASAVASALVYCLYITGDEVARLYARPDLLWAGLPILLYWLGRLWLLANRGEVQEDPIVFALEDRASYVVLAALVVTVVLAS
jgi:4-hydroxybenzoate polyprenyltransferase